LGKLLLAAWIAIMLAGCQPLPPETPSARSAAQRTARRTPTPDLPATIVALERPRLLGSYPSPDGDWRAEVHRYECIETEEGQKMALDVLRLVQVEGKQEIVADRQLQYCEGLGAFGLDGLFWSPEGHYFYYTPAREGGPDGACGPWVRPISRVDLTARGVETLSGAVSSPDGSKLAGWRTSESGTPEIVVWEAEGGEMFSVPVTAPDAVVGGIAWSPDGTALAYLQMKEPCAPSGVTWVTRVTLPEGESAILLESAQPSFSNVAWETTGALNLLAVTGEQLRLDLTTLTLMAEP